VDHGQVVFSPRTLDSERIDLGRRWHLVSPIYLQMVKAGVVRFNPITNNSDQSFPFMLTASMVTVEEVEDEDAPHTVAKKKKKKPKKKKKSVPSADKVDVPETSSPPPSSPIIEPPSPPLLVVEVPPSPPPRSQAKKKKPEKRQPAMRQPNLTSSSMTTFASMSTASLEQTRAQSAHSYLQSENLAEQKVKVKTRAELSSLPPVQEEDTKRGFFSRFSRKREAAPHAPEEETKEKRNLGAWFKNMNRKSGVFLAQILGADKSAKKGGPPMKWDHFVKVSGISARCAF
jgi:DNA polymerase III gamma/tau subunit